MEVFGLMRLVHDDKKKRIIKNQDEIRFSSFSAYHLIILTVRAKGEKQLGESATDDEDLTVQIDGKNFPKVDSNSTTDSPAAFSGGRLHNFAKTVYFLTFLQGKYHKIILNADDPPGTATFEKLEIYTFDPTDKLTLEHKIQAEDGDRRPWITFVLDNIPMKEIGVTITYSRRKRDSDDVKIKIDGQIQWNILRDIKNFLWYFAGSLIPLISSSRTETQVFTTNFSAGFHYIELDADRMPTLEKVILNFGNKLPIPKHTPTVNDPEWTGNFDDDTEEILLARAIYGEAGGESKEAKIAVAWVIRNRVEDTQNRWGKTYHKVILQQSQYEPFSDQESKIFKKITNPPLDNTGELQAWRDSFEVAREVIYGETADNTKGANHFYVPSDQPKQSWVDEKKFTAQIGATRFYKL